MYRNKRKISRNDLCLFRLLMVWILQKPSSHNETLLFRIVILMAAICHSFSCQNNCIQCLISARERRRNREKKNGTRISKWIFYFEIIAHSASSFVWMRRQRETEKNREIYRREQFVWFEIRWAMGWGRSFSERRESRREQKIHYSFTSKLSILWPEICITMCLLVHSQQLMLNANETDDETTNGKM